MTDDTAILAVMAAGTAAVRSADPFDAVARALPAAPAAGRVCVLALGKAASPMARAVEASWGGLGGRLFGAAVTNAREGAPLSWLETIEAAHPEPDDRSEAAARRLLALAEPLGAEDFCLLLISGGGSALACAPIDGSSLAAKQALTRAMLASGATIHEMNAVRKRVSAIKGGRLAAAIAPAASLTLAISDVPGDEPSVIASGPTAPDPSTNADARAVVEKHRLATPAPLLTPPGPVGAPVRPDVAQESFHESFDHVAGVPMADWVETPKPGDPVFARAAFRIVASPRQAVAAAAAALQQAGWPVASLGEEVEGEAAAVGAAHAAEARARAAQGERVALISGGELTVVARGGGRGGPNREYALALALGLDGAPGVYGFAMDTDGVDGARGPAGEPIAGAMVFPDTLRRAAARGLDAAGRLRANDSGGFFKALGDELLIGPTGTNVNDLRVVLVGAGGAR